MWRSDDRSQTTHECLRCVHQPQKQIHPSNHYTLWVQRKKIPWDLTVRKLSGTRWPLMGSGRWTSKRRRAWEPHAKIQLWVKYTMFSIEKNKHKNPCCCINLALSPVHLRATHSFSFPLVFCYHQPLPPSSGFKGRIGLGFAAGNCPRQSRSFCSEKTGRSWVCIWYSALGRPYRRPHHGWGQGSDLGLLLR